MAKSPNGPHVQGGGTVRAEGQQPSTCAAWHVSRNEGESLEDVLARHYYLVPIGTVLVAVADTDVVAGAVTPALATAEPPRLATATSDAPPPSRPPGLFL